MTGPPRPARCRPAAARPGRRRQGRRSRPGGPADAEPAQPDAAGHHERRGGRHRRPGDQRVEEPGRRQRDRGDVVAERPGQVAPDGRQRGPGQPDRVRDDAQVVPQQDQVRGADRHVGARAERQAQVGGGQRGPVVDPVPGHGHPAAPGLQALDHRHLVARQRAGDHLIGADLGRDRLGDGLAVAGQQHRAQAQPAQRGDRRGGRRLDRVGDRDRAAGLAVPAGQHHRAARALPRGALPGQVRAGS